MPCTVCSSYISQEVLYTSLHVYDLLKKCALAFVLICTQLDPDPHFSCGSGSRKQIFCGPMRSGFCFVLVDTIHGF
jgi:hypothetical protein